MFVCREMAIVSSRTRCDFKECVDRDEINLKMFLQHLVPSRGEERATQAGNLNGKCPQPGLVSNHVLPSYFREFAFRG
jgi:hypothetical protein